jgi:glucosamine 6-phosphate synthetase-like amidotransferase/phosphosugar isomerase protein
MCGIAAILLTPQERPAEMWQEIKDCLTQNFLFNEDRGREATGLAVIQADGWMAMSKMPLEATEFVKTPNYKSLLATVGPHTTLLLGHTRHPTKGDPASNDNNHPLLAGPICGIHNGEVDNDDDLFARCGCPRRGQVDSEVIFRLLEPLSPLQLNGNYLTAVRSQLRRLQGAFTFLACDRRTPEKLLVVRHKRPLSVHFHPDWNALIFSSRYIFLRKRFGPILLTETLPHNQLLLYEAPALPQLGHQPTALLSLTQLVA